MTEVHFVIGVSVFALNLFAGIFGITAYFRRKASVAFWYVLRTAQAAVALQLLLGIVLLIAGNRVVDDLHYLYGSLPVVVAFFTEGMRIGAAQKVVGETDYRSLPEPEQRALALDIFRAETRIMALGALFIAALAVRAGMSSGAL